MTPSRSRICIDLTEDDANVLTTEEETEQYCKEIKVLRARVRVLENKSSELESKLKHSEDMLQATQLELGKAVSANAMRIVYSTMNDDRRLGSGAGAPSQNKRTRSPSPELKVSAVVPHGNKGKAKLEEEAKGFKKLKFEEATPCPTIPSQSELLEALKSKYLEPTQSLDIQPPPIPAHVRRVYFSRHYGGSPQVFLPRISKDRNPSGPEERHVAFPQQDFNPAFKSVNAGNPGLIFASRLELANGLPWTMFIKNDPRVAKWTYLGDYVGVVCGKLTPTQFKGLSEKEQNVWVEHVKTHQSGVYFKMRARMILRNEGLIPLENKEEENTLVDEEIKSRVNFDLTADEVRFALHEGHERIGIIRMTCVKYDHVFANDILQNFNEDGILREEFGLTGQGSDSKDYSSTSTRRTRSKPLKRVREG